MAEAARKRLRLRHSNRPTLLHIIVADGGIFPGYARTATAITSRLQHGLLPMVIDDSVDEVDVCAVLAIPAR